ncbi:MAG: hypothetical protein HOY75_17785, partial [Streptomyces sp.]|nr:hypothetical protein [Streptomyces sp.]
RPRRPSAKDDTAEERDENGEHGEGGESSGEQSGGRERPDGDQDD